MDAQKYLKLWEAKKQALFLRAQSAFDLIPSLNDEKCRKQFLTRLRGLEDTKTEFRAAVDKVNECRLVALGEKEGQPDYQVWNSFDDLYEAILDAAETLKTNTDTKSNLNSSNEPTKSKVKLPPLELIEFSGDDIAEWPIFYHSFLTSVHENPNLTDSDRIRFLLSKLKRKALTAASGIPPRAENYSLIWNALIDKYENKRTLANTYLKQILDFKPCTTDSENSIELFIQKFIGPVRALKALDLSNTADFILLYIALSKLSPNTVKQFESEVKDKQIPSFEELESFVKSHCRILSMCTNSNKCHSGEQNKNLNSHAKQTHRSLLVSNNIHNKPTNRDKLCPICNKAVHQVYLCPNFQSKSPFDRYKLAREKHLCFNCLSTIHTSIDCKSVNSCSVCSARHHSSLHFKNNSNLRNTDSDREPPQPSGSSSRSRSSERNTDTVQCNAVSIACSNRSASSVLLSTAVVNALDHYGNAHKIRILLDSASQSNFLTAECCRKLKLPKIKVSSSVQGIGRSTQNISHCTSLTFFSRFDSNQRYTVDAWIINHVTDNLPAKSTILSNLSYLKDLPLADDTFDTPGEIDMLIGAELFPYLLGSCKVVGPPNSPIAIQTSLGYVVMGKTHTDLVATDSNFPRTLCATVQQNNMTNLERLVSQYFELEDVPSHREPILTSEEEECEKIFCQTYRRTEGRYSVALPFKQSPEILGESRNTAFRRFLSLEKRFKTNIELKLEYDAFMENCISLGYLVPWVGEEKGGYFLPHHCVFKPDSSSTRLRVVMDASAKSDANISLNDILYTGPKLHNDMFAILLGFRLFPFALVSDVKQMYSQILVHPEYRKFQKLFWRFSPNEELRTWALTRVTFGLSSSPFLALRTIKQLAMDKGKLYPLAKAVVNRDFFMDDLATSVESEDLALKLHRELLDMFLAGGFELVKWCTNSHYITQNIPLEMRRPTPFDFKIDESLKILGLQWKPSTDTFSFKIIKTDFACTKRTILSLLARIFDPLGFFAPVTILAKMLIKDLWSLKLDWDDRPPSHLIKIWDTFRSTLSSLAPLEIPRHISVYTNSYIDLIGFSDASEKAMGGVVYIRSITPNSQISVSFLCAKSRVTPKAATSIPRLELCAALLLSKLMRFIINTYSSRIKINAIYAFSDSSVVLHWINSAPERWNVFVKNRVSTIQSNISPSCWYHVSGKENPADCLSRGLQPRDFLSHKLWFSGPAWLELDSRCWPITLRSSIGEELDEEQLVVCATAIKDPHAFRILIDRCSSYDKLLRSTAYIFRIVKRRRGESWLITTDELNFAELCLVNFVQKEHFSNIIQLLTRETQSKENTRKYKLPNFIMKLNPFMDKDTIRVGGRLSNAELNYQQIHPILLPKNDHLVNLIIDKYHRSNCHTGPNLVQSLIRQKFWILGGRDLIRRRLKSCNFCFRQGPKPVYPLMGELPAERVQQAKPFWHTGVDYAGPFLVSMTRRRGVRPQKAYLCLFVCLCTKAVHLELASDLSTLTFLNALKRFISRRGPIAVVHSDCGTNFIGAKSHLNELYSFLQSEAYVRETGNELAGRRIVFKQIPPASPHWGSYWESNVKSVKTHLYKVIGNQILSFEEFTTVLAQIESLLNSRPLTMRSTDPSDLAPLTPAHFISQQPVAHLLSEDLTQNNISLLSRYQLLSRLVQDFWKRWHVEYLHTLQVRLKWNTPTNPATVGTVVVIKQENLPPLKWPLGIIEEVYPGRDNIPRVALVKVGSSSYKRPVTKLCPLPLQ